MFRMSERIFPGPHRAATDASAGRSVSQPPPSALYSATKLADTVAVLSDKLLVRRQQSTLCRQHLQKVGEALAELILR